MAKLRLADYPRKAPRAGEFAVSLSFGHTKVEVLGGSECSATNSALLPDPIEGASFPEGPFCEH